MAPRSKFLRLEKDDIRQSFSRNYGEWIKRKWSSTKHPSEAVTVEQDRAETNSALPQHEIHGFTNEIKSLENFLLDEKVCDEFKSLVVVGEYGVGKTALCQTIFNEQDVKSIYAPMIWVSMAVTEATEVGEDKKIAVLKKILKDLGVKDEMFKSIHDEAIQEASTRKEKGEAGVTPATEEISALLYALHLNLRWKKYLIVFDDVREKDHWNEILEDDEKKLKEDNRWARYLSDGFPKGSGGRVIYTTRDETLAKKLVAEEHEIHRLWPLIDPESVWRMYEASLEENKIEIPRKDQKCIKELMNKSRGLPLAARLMGSLVPVFAPDKTDEKNSSSQGQTG